MCDAAMAPAMIESPLAVATWSSANVAEESSATRSAAAAAAAAPTPLSAAALEHRQRRLCALNYFCAKPKSAAASSPHQHHYYDCCMKVHFSALLDHWLGRHCCPKEVAATSANESATTTTSALLHALADLDDNASQVCIENVLRSSQLTSEQGCEDYDAWQEHVLQLVLENNERFSDALLRRLTLLLSSSSSMDLSLLRHLLAKRRYALTASLAEALLSASSSPTKLANSAATEDDRTLLTHAVTHGDRSVALTRLLLLNGARVWLPTSPSTSSSSPTSSLPSSPPPSPSTSSSFSPSSSCVVSQLHAERRHSAFVWLLKALMNDLRLEESLVTLHLLGQCMSEQPSRMRQHVTRSMLALGRGASVNGPLFLRIQLELTHFWSEPSDLRQLCLRRLRHSLGVKRLCQSSVIARLQLPVRLGRMLRLEETSAARRLGGSGQRLAAAARHH